MKNNIGSIDKALRVLIALVFGILFFTHVINGTLGIVLLALATVFILTSLVSFCPLYLPFNISTHKRR